MLPLLRTLQSCTFRKTAEKWKAGARDTGAAHTPPHQLTPHQAEKRGKCQKCKVRRACLGGELEVVVLIVMQKKQKKKPMCFIYILQNYTNIETCSVAHVSCLPLAQAPFLYFSRLHLIFQPHGQ